MSAQFAFRSPPADLAPYVQGFWAASGSTEHHREAVLPNGAVELIFNLADAQRVVGDAHRTSRRFHSAFVAGMQRTPLLIEDEGETDLVGVRFWPGGASAWLPPSLSSLTDRVEDASDCGLKQFSSEVSSRLFEARSLDARFDVLSTALRCHRRGEPIDAKVSWALHAMHMDTEPVPAGVLAKRVGISHKHLIALFDRRVGVSPRTLRRVLRFHGVVARLQGTVPPRSWAQVATEGGYADQAHLIREFQEFAGCTPRTFIEKRTEDGWHLKGDR